MKRKISFVIAFILTFAFAFPVSSIYADSTENSSSETNQDEETVYVTEDEEFSFILKEDGTAELYEYLMKDNKGRVTVPFMININDEVVPVTSIGEYAFFQTGINCVLIPETITSIGEGAFLQCPNLRDFVVPDSVEIIGDCALGFLYDEKSDSINPKYNFKLYGYDEKVTSDYAGVYGFKYYDASTLIQYSEWNGKLSVLKADVRLHKVVIPESIDGKPVIKISPTCFAGSEYLNDIMLPDSLQTIDYYAFAHTGLSEIRIPAGVTKIGGGAFENCYYLEKINIPEGITEISEKTFMNCLSLEPPELSKNIQSIGERAFSGCESFITFTIPSSVYRLEGNVFANCSNLESIKVSPDNYTFYDDNGILFKYEQPNNSQDLVKYPENKSGEEYTVPERTREIYEGAFSNCRNLKKVKISDGTSRLYTAAFSDSELLESVYIPHTVRSIDKNFEGCPNLTVYAEETRTMKEFEEKWNKEIPLKIVYTSSEEEKKNEIINVDINEDNKVDVSDLLIFKRYLLLDIELSGAMKKITDINGDSSVNVFDFIRLKNIVLNPQEP